MVIVLMAFIPDMRVALYVAPIWFLILYVGYKEINDKKWLNHLSLFYHYDELSKKFER